ncbi:MAG: NADH-quinone oxidoreductase subunit L [Acidimicrobiia bacterium]
MLSLVWLIPALPLLGVLLLLVGGRSLREPWAGVLATLMMFGAFGAAVATFAGLMAEDEHHRQVVFHLFDWISVGSFQVGADLLVDPLSVTMVLFITGVGALIHLYSIGYMHGDEGFHRFFLYLNLFAFSMLVLVLGDNMVLTFLGWEGVGACSYWLISFWFTEEANAVAGKKAFVTNRIGDWGFMVATFFTFGALGTLTYSGEGGILEGAGGLATTTATVIAALLFLGACGKSAQLPLYVWLPDAMAGPTPVSALIHAATMVTSGVYLMTRVNPVIAQASDWVPDLIAWVGAATALFAATIAVSQRDIKKVLAYSTISQLGFMFLAVGSGAYIAAIFHMVTHAFFKALLFLGAGSVIHGMHHEQDIRYMGALRKVMPITFGTFIVGWLAIAGVPPFSGFWSKDEILLYAWNNNPALWAVGLVTAALTAFYMSRLVFMVFFGEKRWDDKPADAYDEDAHHAALHPHESPWTMWVPLVVLAVGAFAGGAMQLPFTDDTKLLEHWLHPVVELGEAHLDVATSMKWFLAGIAIAGTLAGIVLAVMVYLQHRIKPVEPELLLRAWRVDETIAAAVDGPGRAVATFTSDIVDREGIDGAVNGVGWLARQAGGRLRVVQTGYVRTYALGIAGGAVLLVGWFLLRSGV